jgi:hypothetical protein
MQFLLPPLANAQPETFEKAQLLHELLQETLELIDEAYDADHSYTASIHQCYRSGNPNILQNLDGLLQSVAELDAERQAFMKRQRRFIDANYDDLIKAVDGPQRKKPLAFFLEKVNSRQSSDN